MRPVQHRAAFSLTELLVVIAILGVLAALLLPALGEAQAKAKRIQCVSQLEQLARAFHGFAHDHRSQFPMQAGAADGGAREFVENGFKVGGDFYFTHKLFAPLASELAAPNILTCPADTRPAAARFEGFGNSNLSYFVNVRADYGHAGHILIGDRNLAAPGSIVALQPDAVPPPWTPALHRSRGNVLFADGHVEQLRRLPAVRADLFLPTVTFAAGPVPSSGGNANPSGDVAPENPSAPSPPGDPGTNQPNHTNAPSPDAPSPARRSPSRNAARAEVAVTGEAVNGSAVVAGAPAVGGSNAPVAKEAEEGEPGFDWPTFIRRARQLVQRATAGTYLLLLLLLAVLIYWEWRRRRKARARRSAILDEP